MIDLIKNNLNKVRWTATVMGTLPWGLMLGTVGWITQGVSIAILLGGLYMIKYQGWEI